MFHVWRYLIKQSPIYSKTWSAPYYSFSFNLFASTRVKGYWRLFSIFTPQSVNKALSRVGEGSIKRTPVPTQAYQKKDGRSCQQYFHIKDIKSCFSNIKRLEWLYFNHSNLSKHKHFLFNYFCKCAGWVFGRSIIKNMDPTAAIIAKREKKYVAT